MRRDPTVYLAATLLLLLAGCRSAPEPPAPAPVVAEAPAPAPEVVPAPAAPTPAPEPPPPLSDDATITVEQRTADGTWAPLPSGRTLPAGPATLRFLISDAGRRADLLELMLKKAVEGVTAEITRPDAATVQVSMLSLPPRLLVRLPTGHNAREFVLYSGEPPHLVALDPATAVETTLAEAPVDIFGARVAPDRRWVLYDAVDPEDPLIGRYWLGNTVTGRLTRIPDQRAEENDFVAWPAGKVLIAGWHRVCLLGLERGEVTEFKSGGEFWGGLSPNGRYLAGYDHDYAGGVAPSNIFVVDLQTGTEQVFPKAVNSLVHNYWVELPIAWAPDGKSLLIEQFVTRDQRQVVRLDLATGAVTPDAMQLPKAPLTSHGWEIINKGWSVLIKGPDGKEHQYGAGLPMGWLPDGRLLLVRWENFKYIRYMPSV